MKTMKKFGKKTLLWVTAVIVVTVVAVVGLWNPADLVKTPGETTPDAPEEIVAGAEGQGYEVPLDVNYPDDLYEDVEINTGSEATSDQNADGAFFSPIAEKLTWEALNAQPIKYPGMPVSERRQYCADFFRFAKTALWTPKEDFVFYTNSEKTSTRTLYANTVYGGVPYVGMGSGSVYRLMDFLDESTGVVDTAKHMRTSDQTASRIFTIEEARFFGNQCSIGSYWGWARVMNSANFKWTQNVVTKNNFVFLGDYSAYKDSEGNSFDNVPSWQDQSQSASKHKDRYTTKVRDMVGEQQMYENFALLELADGLVYYTTAGHLAMCTNDAVVVRNNDGTIDGKQSYILMTDQATKWLTGTSSQGDRFLYEDGVDAKKTFESLYKGSYLPFTYKEFLGTDPVEETECVFSHSGSTITWGQLISARVEANYGISDVYAIVTNDQGEEVYRYIVRATEASEETLPMKENENPDKNVTILGELTSGSYNIEIVVQLGTGERPTVYTGTLKV